MQNPHIHSISHFQVPALPHPLPSLHSHLPLFQLSPNSLSLTLHPLHPTSTPVHFDVPATQHPPLLPYLSVTSSTSLLLALPTGQIFQIDFSTAQPQSYHVADITDPDPHCSGILNLSSSPDTSLHLVVSPVKLILLTPLCDLVSQLHHSHATNAVVSWRPDSDCFVVVFSHTDDSHSGLVVDRDAQHVTSLDFPAPITGNPLVAWEPRVGGLILVTVKNQAFFFERNGLRHLRTDFHPGLADIHALAWSFDARWLAIAGHWGHNYEVRLFSRRNYKWYCGRRIRVCAKVAAMSWSEDNLAEIAIYLKDGHVVKLDVLSCVHVLPIGRGRVACTVDGDQLFLTDFGTALVPPPMFHVAWRFEAGIYAVSDKIRERKVGVLLEDGTFETRIVREEEFGAARVEKKMNGHVVEGEQWKLKGASEDGPILSMRWPIWLSEGVVAVVDHAADRTMTSDREELIRVFHLIKGAESGTCVATHAVLNGCVTAIASSALENAVIMTTSNGSLTQLAVNPGGGDISTIESIAWAGSDDVITVSDHAVEDGRTLAFTMGRDGHLEVVELTTGRSVLISTDCTSYHVHLGFLCFTTSSHLLYCMFMGKAKSKSYHGDKGDVPCLLDALDGKDDSVEKTVEGWKITEGKGAMRPIDRGSLIVSDVADVEIVLQAPRGNLETIALRPIVFEAVDILAKQTEYRKAFMLCRRHRVNMNHIADANLDLFIDNIAKFVAEVDDEAHLNVFMTLFSGPVANVNTVCDEIVRVLSLPETRSRYTNAILTGLIRRQPSDINAALDEISFARDNSTDEGVSALNYLLLLVKNETKVYGEALGRYDLDLALFVAKNSQMDPADYSSELKKFSDMEERMRKYSIDTRLERHDKALRHLHSLGVERREQCLELCSKYGLYETALELFRDDLGTKKRLLQRFAHFLDGKDKHEQAARMFIKLGDWLPASESYRKGGQWELSASAVSRSSVPWSHKRNQLQLLAQDLYEKGRYAEAADIRANHLGDLEGAVESLAKAEEWDKMFEIVAGFYGQCQRGLVPTENKSASVFWKEVDGFVIDAGNGMLDTIIENKGKMKKNRQRLDIVRAKKREMNERLAAKEGAEGEEGSDAFTATTASSMASNLSDVTFRTRSSTTSLYSSATVQVGPLSEGKLRKQEARRKRKEAKKRVKQGSPREEEYLTEYLRRITPGEFFRGRVGALVRALCFVGRFDLALEVMREMGSFLAEAKLVPVDVLGEETFAQLWDTSWADGTEHLHLH